MINSILIYTITFAISIAFSTLYSKTKKKSTQLIIIGLSISIPIFIATYRNGVGIDYYNYQKLYHYIIINCTSLNNIFSYYIESGYVILNLLANIIFKNYKGVLFLSSSIYMIASFKGITNYKTKISVSLAYFIFLVTMYSPFLNGMRQFIAVAIFFNSYIYIYNRNFWKFFLLVIIASLFHKSALLCLPMYFLWADKGRNSKVYYILVIIITAIMPLLIPIISNLFTKIGIYNSYFQYNIKVTYGFFLYLIPILSIFIVTKKYILKEETLQFLLRLYTMQIPLQLLGNFIGYADRLSLYVVPSQIILFPYYVKMLNKNKKIIKFFIVAWYIFYYYYMFIFLNSNGVYPYAFNFN